MNAELLSSFQGHYAQEEFAVGDSVWSYRQTRGAGPTMLLLPGAQGTGDMFYKTAMALGERFNIVTVTYPGGSDSVAMADQLSLLLDALSLPRVHLLGSSLGGYIVQLFALKHSERIESLFIANTFCDATPFQAAMPKPDEFAKTPADAMLRSTLEKIAAAPELEPVHAELKAVLQALIGPVQSAETLKARWLAVLSSKPVPPLPLSHKRIVMIDDDDDPVIPPPMRASMRERYAGVEHHAIAGGGHYPGILRAEEYARVIERRLLASQSS